MPLLHIGHNSGVADEVETNHYAARVTQRPIDVGSLGSYSVAAVSGTMAAGIGAAAIIYAARFGGSGFALVRRVLFEAVSLGTGFTAGIGLLALTAARSFTANDTGGTTLTASKIRTTMAGSGMADLRISSTAALGAGTRTPDSQAVGQLLFTVPVTTNFQLINLQTPIVDRRVGEWPLVLANNEGFELTVTVPATGTWQFKVQTDWDEVSAYGQGLAT